MNSDYYLRTDPEVVREITRLRGQVFNWRFLFFALLLVLSVSAWVDPQVWFPADNVATWKCRYGEELTFRTERGPIKIICPTKQTEGDGK